MNEITKHDWGQVEILDQSATSRTSKVTLLLGAKIPLRYYDKTGEIWNPIAGVGAVYIGTQPVDEEADKVQREIMAKEGHTLSARVGDIINILPKKVHGVENLSSDPFIFIRIEHGEIDNQKLTEIANEE